MKSRITPASLSCEPRIANGEPRLFVARFVEELEHQLQDALVDATALVGAEFLLECFERHDGLGHRPMPAGTSDVAEPALDEVAGIARVAQVADRYDEAVVDDAAD